LAEIALAILLFLGDPPALIFKACSNAIAWPITHLIIGMPLAFVASWYRSHLAALSWMATCRGRHCLGQFLVPTDAALPSVVTNKDVP